MLDPITVLSLMSAGLLAGLLSGLLGIGGGIVTIPILFTLFTKMGVDPLWRMHMSIATALAIIVMTNASSARAHYKHGAFDWGLIRALGSFLVIGALLGTMVAKELKTVELIYSFALLAIIIGLKMILPLDHIRFGDQMPRGLKAVFAPFLIGFLSAIMGIGGGSFMVPYMTFYGMTVQRAIGHASFLGIIISLTATLGYMGGGFDVAGLAPYHVGFVHIPSVLAIGLCAMVSAPYGARLAHRLPKRLLSVFFGLFLVFATLRLINAV